MQRLSAAFGRLAWVSSRAQSRAVWAIGPMLSSDADKGTHPCALMRRNVVFRPVTPHMAAGMRIDPAVSLPMEPNTRRAATATPEPLDEPPQTWSAFQGLSAGP